MLKKYLQNLIDELKNQLDTKSLEFEKLESITSSLIINDEFDSLPDYIQSEVYFIDNFEIEEPSFEQLVKSRDIIENYVSINALPNVKYDEESDAAYISLTEILPGEAEDTIILGQPDDRVKGMINLDFDKDGKLLGVEVLDASKVLRKDLLSDLSK